MPCHADIPAVEAHFLDKVDDKTDPLKIKGVDEPGSCGVGAALANVVYTACGVWFREYPITPDKVLADMARWAAPTGWRFSCRSDRVCRAARAT